jgi:tetratricopeptide (TPR) repeat protein
MRGKPQLIAFAVAVLAAGLVFADAQSDAQKLKDEALDVLKANSARQASVEQYAGCIFKLEQAQAILEKAGDTNSALVQEVSSSLFWARRFSNIQVLAALDKLHGGKATPPPPPKKVEPPKSADNPDEPPPLLAEAKKAFTAAQGYADAHKSDDYAVALRWFQMAAENPGTDYALKALELARAAQSRFAAKTKTGVPEEALPDTPEMKLVKEGDALAEEGKYEESVALYLASLKAKDSLVAHRRLGHAYYMRAQHLKDELLPKFEAAEAERRAAFKEAYITVRMLGGSTRRRFNPNYPPLVEAQRQEAELGRQAQVSISYYDKAQDEFKAVLRLAPGQKDLDAAGHQALCLTVKGDMNARARGKMMLLAFLADYTPANDLERSLYEFCKTELDRLKKGG